jgi:hypothetical protein
MLVPETLVKPSGEDMLVPETLVKPSKEIEPHVTKLGRNRLVPSPRKEKRKTRLIIAKEL